MPVTHRIYHAAQAPLMPGRAHGACRFCGINGIGEPFAAWVKDTFTDWDKLRLGEIVCHACLFCTSEATPGLAERVGKDKAQKFRNYSHFVLDGVWYPLSKGAKASMRRLLFAGAEVAVIAESGQKHLAPFACDGWWTFELAQARPFPDELRSVLAVVEPLYQAGISKTEIESGRYDGKRIIAAGVDRWRAAEAQIRQWRGGLPLLLALFFAQKEDDDDGLSTDC